MGRINDDQMTVNGTSGQVTQKLNPSLLTVRPAAVAAKVGSYTGLIPCEDSSAGRQRLGHISKQGNSLLGIDFRVPSHSQATVVRSFARHRSLRIHRYLNSSFVKAVAHEGPP